MTAMTVLPHEVMVELSPQEMTTAAMVGVRRRIHMLVKEKREGKNPYTLDDCPFEGAIVGAMAELAVASQLNLFWSDNVGERNAIDVGGKVEVRARRFHGCGLDLGMRAVDKDKFHLPYVLVHADPPYFKLVGWLYGHDAWRLGAPTNTAWLRFVPATVPPLREIAELREILRLAESKAS